MNPKNNCGVTPLHKAVEKGNLDLCKYIMDRTQDIELIDIEGRTPLHHAARKGHIKVYKYIMLEILAVKAWKDLAR